jgi:hypothetical protein
MTQRREWPNSKAECRDQAAECAMEGIRALKPLVNGQVFDRTETLRRIAVALEAFLKIAWLLCSAGAPIKPEDVQ